MPKNSTSCYLTATYNKRVAFILATSLRIVVLYRRCKKLGLKYIVELTTKYCAYYICTKARCSLVFSNTKRKKINNT